jgi:hypothetical protein
MLKKIFTIGFLFSLIVLCWCDKKWWFQYEFENFYWFFDTEKNFEINDKSLSSLWYKILSDNILKIYVEDSNSTFTDSIIITKKNSDKSVESFWKENLEDIDISGLKMSKWKKIEVECGDNNVCTLLYYQWKYDMNQYDIYLTYWFLKLDNEIYIISYATLDEKSRNDFSSSFKTLKYK